MIAQTSLDINNSDLTKSNIKKEVHNQTLTHHNTCPDANNKTKPSKQQAQESVLRQCK